MLHGDTIFAHVISHLAKKSAAILREKLCLRSLDRDPKKSMTKQVAGCADCIHTSAYNYMHIYV